jgi:hypothetical protein
MTVQFRANLGIAQPRASKLDDVDHDLKGAGGRAAGPTRLTGPI